MALRALLEDIAARASVSRWVIWDSRGEIWEEMDKRRESREAMLRSCSEIGGGGEGSVGRGMRMVWLGGSYERVGLSRERLVRSRWRSLLESEESGENLVVCAACKRKRCCKFETVSTREVGVRGRFLVKAIRSFAANLKRSQQDALNCIRF